MTFRVNLEYAKKYDKYEIDDDIILYEVRNGGSISDSPFAIFQYLVNHQHYSNFKHIWVLKKSVKPEQFNISESLKKRMIFVEYGSKDYVHYLLQAKYLINNSTFPSFFVKKEEQIYINTWHGTPLKKMGFDVKENIFSNANVERNLLMADYFISPNHHTTQTFLRAYKLGGISNGTIIETGYPRIDFTLETNHSQVTQFLKERGFDFDENLPLIAYMPTWRGKSTENPKDSIEQLVTEFSFLKEQLKGRYNLLLKVHPFIFDKVKNIEEISASLISDQLDCNQILSAVDILITDFSSVFFDFLSLNRPIIFYGWDEDLYEKERGLYFDSAELPGQISRTVYEIIETIDNIEQYDYGYLKEWSKDFIAYDDGQASKRCVEYIFEGKISKKMKRLSLKDLSKKSLVIYPGNLENNGITISIINLINALDLSKYDLTLILNQPSKLAETYIDKMQGKVRLLFNSGKPLLPKKLKFSELCSSFTKKNSRAIINTLSARVKKIIRWIKF